MDKVNTALSGDVQSMDQILESGRQNILSIREARDKELKLYNDKRKALRDEREKSGFNSEADAQIFNLENIVIELEAKKLQFEDKIEDFEYEIEKIYNTISECENRQSELESTIYDGSFSSSKEAKVERKISLLDEEIERLQQRRDNLDSKVEWLDDTLIKLEDRIDLIENKITLIDDSYNSDYIEDINRDVEDLWFLEYELGDNFDIRMSDINIEDYDNDDSNYVHDIDDDYDDFDTDDYDDDDFDDDDDLW